MAYITPDTELQFFRNLHIDPDHENSIYFPDEATKDAYFDNLSHVTADQCYYQRERRGYCRVEIPIGTLLKRTYMRFKNKQFENRWFYAFVDSVEYINNITTEVKYTIDPLMTYMGSFTLDECYVERQHTETDEIGDNVVPENVPLNRFINNEGFSDTQESPQRSDVIGDNVTDWEYLVVLEPDINDAPSGVERGYYSGLVYHTEPTAAALTSYINSYFPNLDPTRIQGIYYVPKAFDYDPAQPLTSVPPRLYTKRLAKPVKYVTPLDGYVPNNNKLLTYPFNYISVYNSEGESAEFRFENFIGVYAEFWIRGITGEQSQITCTPSFYNTEASSVVSSMPIDFRYTLTMKDFPMCAWTVDTFKAYLAQQMVTIPFAGASALETAITGGKYVEQSADTLLSATKNTMLKAMHPREAKGSNTPLLTCSGQFPYKDFWFFRTSIYADEAKRLDDYFTMFGYAVNELRVPNMQARPFWTYIKTIGCHLNWIPAEGMPSDDMRAIENYFNQGIRLWNGPALDPAHNVYVGNYSLINKPVPNP